MTESLELRSQTKERWSLFLVAYSDYNDTAHHKGLEMLKFRAPVVAFVIGSFLAAHSCFATPYDDGLSALQAGRYSDALRLLQQAAKAGNSEAETVIGNMYINAEGVPENPQEAVRWYKLAASHGNANGIVNLAECYDNGTGVQRNPTEANRLLKQGAEKGNALAQFDVGRLYEKSDETGWPIDKNQAVLWYDKSAAQNFPQAEFNLSMIYLYDAEFASKRPSGLSLLHRAASHGLALAQQNLGAKYIDGSFDLIKQDTAQGLYWENLAAAQFNGQALSDLGVVYLNGAAGISADPVEAAKWFGLAAISYRQDKAMDKSVQVSQYYYSITQKLTESQISDVKRRARDFIQLNKIREK